MSGRNPVRTGKRIGGRLLATAMAGTLTACGGGSPGDEPPDAAETAAVCHDPSTHRTGTRIVQRHRVTVGTQVVDTEMDSETLGPRTFGGNNTIAVRTQLTSTAGTVSNGHEFTTYSRFDGPEYRVFGVEIVLPATATTAGQSSRITYTPSYLAANAALSPGQSYSQTYTQTSVRTDIQPPPPAQSLTINETNTFAGFETVTVPAGTFPGACKWERGPAFTFWHARGSGILLKSVRNSSPMSEEVLVSATRDGVPVTP